MATPALKDDAFSSLLIAIEVSCLANPGATFDMPLRTATLVKREAPIVTPLAARDHPAVGAAVAKNIASRPKIPPHFFAPV